MRACHQKIPKKCFFFFRNHDFLKFFSENVGVELIAAIATIFSIFYLNFCFVAMMKYLVFHSKFVKISVAFVSLAHFPESTFWMEKEKEVERGSEDKREHTINWQLWERREYNKRHYFSRLKSSGLLILDSVKMYSQFCNILLIPSAIEFFNVCFIVVLRTTHCFEAIQEDLKTDESPTRIGAPMNGRRWRSFKMEFSFHALQMVTFGSFNFPIISTNRPESFYNNRANALMIWAKHSSVRVRMVVEL